MNNKKIITIGFSIINSNIQIEYRYITALYFSFITMITGMNYYFSIWNYLKY